MTDIKYTPEVQAILEDPNTSEEDRNLLKNLLLMNQQAKQMLQQVTQVRKQNETK